MSTDEDVRKLQKRVDQIEAVTKGMVTFKATPGERVQVVPPNIKAFLRYFKWDHLPVPLQAYSAPFANLANNVLLQAECALADGATVDWAEVMVGLRNILIAKDNIVRAFLPQKG